MLPSKKSAHSVPPFCQLWLTYKQIHMSEELYYINTYICIYMLVIAGRTAQPKWLNVNEATYGYPGSDKG